MPRTEVMFTGFGGQGIVLSGIILARAAVYDNKGAIQTQSYGPEARGGATRSDVIIADTEIFFPKVFQPNILVCLTQLAYNKYSTIIRPGGLLVTDTRYVNTERKVDARQVELPLYEAVMERIGKPIVLNICMLGAVVGLTDLVKPDSIMKVLQKRIPASFLKMNREALQLGRKLVSEDKG